jgi:hypothetical protein
LHKTWSKNYADDIRRRSEPKGINSNTHRYYRANKLSGANGYDYDAMPTLTTSRHVKHNNADVNRHNDVIVMTTRRCDANLRTVNQILVQDTATYETDGRCSKENSIVKSSGNQGRRSLEGELTRLQQEARSRRHLGVKTNEPLSGDNSSSASGKGGNKDSNSSFTSKTQTYLQSCFFSIFFLLFFVLWIVNSRKNFWCKQSAQDTLVFCLLSLTRCVCVCVCVYVCVCVCVCGRKTLLVCTGY